MEDRLNNLRMAFPAEVTGAFLAAREVLGTNQYDFAMLAFLGILLIINVGIYMHFYKIRSPFYLGFISIGFLLWAVSVDSARLKDFLFGYYDPFIPLLLILYTLFSTFIALPKLNQGPESN